MTFPVSVKGVVLHEDKVLLLKNPRDEWELPGGRLEIGETPEQCVAREIAEETGWRVHVGPVLDTWLYHVESVHRHVFVVTYGCHPNAPAEVVLSTEHVSANLFHQAEISALNLPRGYHRAIDLWFSHPERSRRQPPPEPGGRPRSSLPADTDNRP
ncbi:NUDIX hydrolase [Actinophytocola glycyrrhizae]|uniref:NUDIX domain-containing protein n=1 Tax=Actinophytocola glycyrrhizae TaxID=2044873 RepID=A0ABV9S5K8_9PSEU